MLKKQFIVFCLLVTMLFTGCGPTVTPEASRWEVEVMSSEVAPEFDTWSFPDGSESIMVVVTLEYRYHGQDQTIFLPESIILANTGTEGFSVWGKTPRLYKAEGTSQIVDFQADSLFNYLDPGATRIDTFVWEWPNNKYTEFRLLFPEAEAIDIRIGDRSS